MRTAGLQQADLVRRQLGREARSLRRAAGLSQAALASATGISRRWIHEFELGGLQSPDLRRSALLFACLGHRLVAKAHPTGQPLRDAGQERLLRRFVARLSPTWRREAESVMPRYGDLRAWDMLLTGPVRIGVEAETHPSDLQAIERAVATKLRDSRADRAILLIASTHPNRALIRQYVGTLRQTFPLDTRAMLDALARGRDPGDNGLVIL